MARKKSKPEEEFIPAPIEEQPITETLDKGAAFQEVL